MVVLKNKYIMMNMILFVPLILFLLKVFLFFALVTGGFRVSSQQILDVSWLLFL